MKWEIVMPRPSSGPLTDTDYSTINRKLAQQEAVRIEIEKALEAGFPCAEQDAACKAIRDQLTQIKRVYFPDRP